MRPGLLRRSTPAQGAALCTTPTAVSPDADDAFTADLVVDDPLTSAGGSSVPCGYTGCVVVLSDAGQPPVSNVAISFGPPLLTITPSDGILDGSNVVAAVAGTPDTDPSVVQCLLPLGATRQASRCAESSYGFNPDRWGSGTVSLPASATIDEPGDCRTGSCVFVMSENDGTFFGDPVPITFAPPPTVTLAPASGLLDGQSISVTGQYLLPGEYTLLHCKDGDCDQGSTFVTVGSDGRLDATVPALQRFTNSADEPVYCRADECEVALNSLERGVVASAAYELAAGAVAAAPDTGLSDGQTVQVSGTDLMPTYDGPPIWVFPTGGWALTECDAAVLDDLSLIGVFTHCSVPPPTRGVVVEGSTLDETLQVEATIDKIFGGTTDCTASAGACVVGLVRLEQDGSLSAHLTSIGFTQ